MRAAEPGEVWKARASGNHVTVIAPMDGHMYAHYRRGYEDGSLVRVRCWVTGDRATYATARFRELYEPVAGGGA